MKKLSIILSTLLLTTTLLANTQLDSLLLKVKKEATEQSISIKARESVFLKEKAKQKQLLKEARTALNKTEANTKRLSDKFDKNEKSLTELESKLTLTMGTLGEMFGVVKQISGDLKAQFENSIISSQFRGRDEFISKLAGRKKLPNINELKRLWFEIMGEISESGKVVKYTTTVVEANGLETKKEITRVGTFNLISGGKYFVYQGDIKKIVELSRQPDSRYLSMATDLEEDGEKINAFGIDPSRGVLLSMLVNAPSLMERFHQGGIVGYVIMALLALGLVIVGERLFKLTKEKKLMMAQLNTDHASESNSLGRLMLAFGDNKQKDLDALELKMDESILKSLPTIEKGVGTVKILAAVAPLMGLLGTVTGMIGTFQSITLFGTGDPKLMAGGISTALITTVLGLICAIPLLLLHNVIAGKSKELVQILEEQSAGLLAKKAELVEQV